MYSEARRIMSIAWEVESLAGVEVGVPWLMMCGICCGFCALFAVANHCVAPIGL